MEEGLRRHIETDNGIAAFCHILLLPGRTAFRRFAELNANVLDNGMLEIGGTHQVQLGLHLLSYSFCLHLGGTFQLFGKALGREAIVVNLADAVVQIGVILHHHERRRVEEMQETLLHGLLGSQFRHHFDALALVFGELVFDIEGANGIDFITEEIDTERELATVGIDIDDASTHGKLAWLIDIIYLLE